MKEIIELTQNEEDLYNERQKALKSRDKFIGINSDCRFGMSGSKSCSFDETRRANESIMEEKKWQNRQQILQNDIYDRINDFTSKIKNIIDKRKEDESSEDEDKRQTVGKTVETESNWENKTSTNDVISQCVTFVIDF